MYVAIKRHFLRRALVNLGHCLLAKNIFKMIKWHKLEASQMPPKRSSIVTKTTNEASFHFTRFISYCVAVPSYRQRESTRAKEASRRAIEVRRHRDLRSNTSFAIPVFDTQPLSNKINRPLAEIDTEKLLKRLRPIKLTRLSGLRRNPDSWRLRRGCRYKLFGYRGGSTRRA